MTAGDRPAPAGGEVRVRRVETCEDLKAAYALRTEVFVDEQHVPAEEELDDSDANPTTAHVIAERGGVVVGTGRLLSDPAHPGVVHVGRVAVRRQGRGTGVGRAVMAALEEIALASFGVVDDDDGGRHVRIELSAQEQAVGFYEELGYTVGQDRYLDAGIWHRDAMKVVPGA